MRVTYVDESGDPGERGSKSYTLACVMVDDEAWPTVFDELITFRRFLRDNFGLRVRAEVKANYLLQNTGPLRDLELSEGARFRIYRGHMRLQPKLGLQSFAVVIRKAELWAREPGRDPRDVAWEYLLQRLERMTTKGEMTALLNHDEGEAHLVRKLTRKARRAGTAGSMFGRGTLRVPARLLLDDPVPRDSAQSYFLQLADLAAYAAFRYIYPPPSRRVQICPQSMWDELGDARYALATSAKGGPSPGLIVWPS